MGYKKLSKFVAQLLTLLKNGEYKTLTALDRDKLLSDIEKQLF
jgi:hypothetical protein